MASLKNYIDDNGNLSTLITRSPEVVAEKCIDWIKNYFTFNAAPGAKAVIGISGGKDSAIVAALCVEALGKERVIGVQMPNKVQNDLAASDAIIHHLGIQSIHCNIGDMMDGLKKTYKTATEQTMAAGAYLSSTVRMRMIILYAIAQSMTPAARVANTCNYSEDYVGYFTRYGDGAGDFSPLGYMVVEEVKAIGRVLGLPEVLIEKTPDDGVCGKTDEEAFGFSYKTLDCYIRVPSHPIDEMIANKIREMHDKALFKLHGSLPTFKYKTETGHNVIGKPVYIKGDVYEAVERLRNSKTSFMIAKPKNHDLIVKRMPPGISSY